MRFIPEIIIQCFVFDGIRLNIKIKKLLGDWKNCPLNKSTWCSWRWPSFASQYLNHISKAHFLFTYMVHRHTFKQIYIWQLTNMVYELITEDYLRTQSNSGRPMFLWHHFNNFLTYLVWGLTGTLTAFGNSLCSLSNNVVSHTNATSEEPVEEHLHQSRGALFELAVSSWKKHKCSSWPPPPSGC